MCFELKTFLKKNNINGQDWPGDDERQDFPIYKHQQYILSVNGYFELYKSCYRSDTRTTM